MAEIQPESQVSQNSQPVSSGAPASQGPSENDVKENKTIAAIAYIGILCFVPLLTKKDSPFAQFHAKQGLVLFISEIVWWILCFGLGFIPILGLIIIWLGNLCLVVLSLVGLVRALNGERWKMPVLGEWAEKIKI